jgi:hypothetical protein
MVRNEDTRINVLFAHGTTPTIGYHGPNKACFVIEWWHNVREREWERKGEGGRYGERGREREIEGEPEREREREGEGGRKIWREREREEDRMRERESEGGSENRFRR